MKTLGLVVGAVVGAFLLSGCARDGDRAPGSVQEALRAQKKPLPLAAGQDIFRFQTFGDEQFWTGTLRMHEVITDRVTPEVALLVGLKVDADALPPGILETADLKSTKTTIALIGLNAVVGVQGTVVDGQLTSVGITCALCHSTVDDSVIPGIGRRLDGWPNRQLDPGLIISLSKALTPQQRADYASWGPGRYDARYNFDGISAPVWIPPAYGLAGAFAETFTGDGTISYWNAYVATTQMGGKGTFSEPRLNINVVSDPDLVTPRLPALLAYQLSLAAPPPPPGSFDAEAAARGRDTFQSACAGCHQGDSYTQRELHAADDTGMEPLHAKRSATGQYRTTPLRALWQHPPYFHDGSAEDLGAVVDHYARVLPLELSTAQRTDLIEFLKSL